MSLPRIPGGWPRITEGDDIPDAAVVYHEVDRPQFHFTSRRGWLNDPNGLVWQAGTYHLFYQHNPYGWNWGNMHWGHAVSPDLVHWKELPTALYPRKFGDWCFSGSAVVDEHNTSGFQEGDQPPLVVAFTSTGRGECIAFSNDRGKTWKEYPENPVVKHPGRDPRLVWYGPGRHWVMAVYDETGGRQGIAFYTSPDLKHWTFQSKIEGFFECPDLFELPVDGRPAQDPVGPPRGRREVRPGRLRRPVVPRDLGEGQAPGLVRQLLRGAVVQQHARRPADSDRLGQRGHISGDAVQPADDGSRASSPFATVEDGPRMFAQPVAELTSLRGTSHPWIDLTLAPGDNPLRDLRGDLFEIAVDLQPGEGRCPGAGPARHASCCTTA